MTVYTVHSVRRTTNKQRNKCTCTVCNTHALHERISIAGGFRKMLCSFCFEKFTPDVTASGQLV